MIGYSLASLASEKDRASVGGLLTLELVIVAALPLLVWWSGGVIQKLDNRLAEQAA